MNIFMTLVHIKNSLQRALDASLYQRFFSAYFWALCSEVLISPRGIETSQHLTASSPSFLLFHPHLSNKKRKTSNSRLCYKTATPLKSLGLEECTRMLEFGYLCAISDVCIVAPLSDFPAQIKCVLLCCMSQLLISEEGFCLPADRIYTKRAAEG